MSLIAEAKKCLGFHAPDNHVNCNLCGEILAIAPQLARAYLAMREALEWYANDKNHDNLSCESCDAPSEFCMDEGRRARAVLEGD